LPLIAVTTSKYSRRQPRFQELDVRGHIVDDQNARSHELYLRIAQKVADSLDEFAD
jgi:hypothetical protein